MCQPECETIKILLDAYLICKQPLSAIIPARFEKRCLSDVTKAGRRGYTIKTIEDTEGILPACLDILDSSTTRQGKPTSKVYMTFAIQEIPLDKLDLWPIANYADFTCSQHRCCLLACYSQEGRIVGLLEYVKSDGDILTTMALGHKQYLKDGIMNLLFHTAMTSLRDGDRFYYGQVSQLSLPIAMFFKGLGIGDNNARS